MTAECSLLKDARVANESVRDEVSCGRENRKNNNVGMDFKNTHRLKELVWGRFSRYLLPNCLFL